MEIDIMWIYLLILVAKIIEVTLATVRIVLITKGEKTIGAIIAFFEILIWIAIVSNVITGLASDPLKAVFYALGFALGNYFGSMLEERIGLGVSEVQIIVKEEHGEELAAFIRDQGYAVTVIEGFGLNQKRHILYAMLPRKQVRLLTKQIKVYQDNSVITVHEIKPVYGGHGITK